MASGCGLANGREGAGPSRDSGGRAFPDMPARERRAGFICAIAVLFVWAGFIISGRAGSRTGLTPWDMGALRYIGSFLAALPLLVRGRLPWPGLRAVAVILGCASFGFALLAYFAFGLAPASHGAVLIPGGLPFVSAAVMWAVLGERFSRRRGLALGLTALGMALLAWDTFAGAPGSWRGDLVFVIAIVIFSGYMLGVRVWGISARTATLTMCLYAAPLYLPFWPLLPSHIHEVSWSVILTQTVMQGVLSVFVANYLFTRAMVALGPATLTAVTSLVPGIAALGAWVLLGEPLGPAGLVGVALAGAATVLAVGRR